MGFLDYAWNVSFQKDKEKLKIVLDPYLDQPNLKFDGLGFTINLPIVQLIDDNWVSFSGYKFLFDSKGIEKIGRIYRAAVQHLTVHTLMQFREEETSTVSGNPNIYAFSQSLVRDAYVNAYFKSFHPKKIVDIAYANSIAFVKMKSLDRIYNSSTKIMTALISKLNLGLLKGSLNENLGEIVDRLSAEFAALQDAFIASLNGEKIDVEYLSEQYLNSIKSALEPFGPFLESPSLPYTEKIGSCSIFNKSKMPSEVEIETIFRKSNAILGRLVPPKDELEKCWLKKVEIETRQAFDSELYQKNKRDKIISRLSEYAKLTKFKSVNIPDEDYTQYLRTRMLLKGGSRRLLDSLRVAQDALDEDPGKEMGQIDLTAVIQALASKKPATEVFFKDEYLSRSFSWSILLDVSGSMKLISEKTRALAICVAEVAKELLMDPGSWTFFAFNDKFYILKDNTEAYTKKVRARIGGLKFEGLTFMPDAIQIAGQILTKRYDEQRILIIISDGLPYGYKNIPFILKEKIDFLVKKDVLVIGIGVDTDRMCKYFKLNASVYNQKDLIKRFAKIFLKASAAALET